MNKIIVTGSSNTDMVIKAERLPLPGETVLGGTFLMNPGGKGANQAVAAVRLGGKVSFIAKTGNDVFGEQSVKLYREEGIQTAYVFTDPDHPSGVALISVDSKGENCIAVASGANAFLSVADIEQARTEIETGSFLLMQLEIPLETVEYAARLAKTKGIKVILNPAPAQELPLSLYENLYLITPNKTEAERLSGIKIKDRQSAEKAAEEIARKGVENVIITLGAKGALIKERDIFRFVEAEKVTAVDTTAAGDTFNGALCVALSERKGLIDAVKFASVAAAVSVTRMGAQSSIPNRNEISNF
jgi:ribokinase